MSFWFSSFFVLHLFTFFSQRTKKAGTLFFCLVTNWDNTLSFVDSLKKFCDKRKMEENENCSFVSSFYAEGGRENMYVKKQGQSQPSAFVLALFLYVIFVVDGFVPVFGLSELTNSLQIKVLITLIHLLVRHLEKQDLCNQDLTKM
jgi:hypothetical protein